MQYPSSVANDDYNNSHLPLMIGTACMVPEAFGILLLFWLVKVIQATIITYHSHTDVYNNYFV